MSDYLTRFIYDDLEKTANKPAPAKPAENRGKTRTIKPDLQNSPSIYLKDDDSMRIEFKARKTDKPEEIVIPRFDKSIGNLINRSVILYGGSDTGKTTIIKDFMYILQKVYPFVFGFLPTNDEKHDFDEVLSRPLIYEKFSIENIEKIYQRQKAAAEIYNNANNLDVLDKLFNRICNNNHRIKLKKMRNYRDKMLAEINKKCDFSIRKKKIKETKAKFNEEFVKFYKEIIIPATKKLQTMNLSPEEKYALKYKNFNPRILILFDDAYVEIMAMIKEGRTKNMESIKNFFFKGRHVYITHVYGFQDDNRLDSDIRKGAFHSIFTSKQVAMGFFSRQVNGFTLHERKRAEAIIDAVFGDHNKGSFVKLVYSRNAPLPFTYILADEHDDKDIKMCSSIVREYCKTIQNNQKFDTDNPYFAQFAADI